MKKSVIECHISSQKHKRGKERIASKTKYELEITESLKRVFHPVGETLPESTRVYRVRVVTTMLTAIK